jgi:hypothetical protein
MSVHPFLAPKLLPTPSHQTTSFLSRGKSPFPLYGAPRPFCYKNTPMPCPAQHFHGHLEGDLATPPPSRAFPHGWKYISRVVHKALPPFLHAPTLSCLCAIVNSVPFTWNAFPAVPREGSLGHNLRGATGSVFPGLGRWEATTYSVAGCGHPPPQLGLRSPTAGWLLELQHLTLGAQIGEGEFGGETGGLKAGRVWQGTQSLFATTLLRVGGQAQAFSESVPPSWAHRE